MRFARIEWYFFKEATSFQKVCLGSCFTDSMYHNDLILFGIIWCDCYKIVSLRFFKLEVSLFIIPERYFYSKALAVLNCILLVVCPVLNFAHIRCNLGFGNYFFSLFFCNSWIFPDHEFNMRTMSKADNVFGGPIYAKDGLDILFLP